MLPVKNIGEEISIILVSPDTLLWCNILFAFNLFT